MQIVIDANIIIAMLIRPGKPIEAFFDDNLEIFAPVLLFDEINQNKDEIITKSYFSANELDHLFFMSKCGVENPTL